MKKASKILAIAFHYCFWYIIANIAILLLTTGISISMTFLYREIINELVSSVMVGKMSRLFVILIVFYLLMYFLQQASGFMRSFGNNFFRLNVDSLFHRIFMWKSYKTPQERFYDSKYMETYSFVSRHTQKISSYIGNLCTLIFSNIGSLIGTMTIFAVYEPLLIIYSFVVGVITFYINGVYANKEYDLDKKQIPQQRFADYYRELLTGKGSAKELRIYRLKDCFYKKWLDAYDSIREEKLSLSLKKIKTMGAQTLIKLVLRMVAVSILIVGIYNKKYDAGTFVMLFGLAETCVSGIDGLARVIMSGSYKDIKYLSDYYDMVMPITDEDIRKILSLRQEDSMLEYGAFQELIAQDLCYTYPSGTKRAVENVSFALKKGEIVSILGYNGSGKTTLSKLLNGSLSPDKGMVKINGVPISDKNREVISRYFGNAPQEFPHFSLPLCDVVGLGYVEKMGNQNELDSAYEKAELNDLITKLDNGEHSILGKEYDDNGIDLSGGQWQRITIASAYMGQPEILIFDEPTASIDPLREMEMLKNFRKNLAGKTAILISHRIGFARLADRIIMMEDGKITEQGSHEELIRNGGTYAKLFYTQMQLYEEKTV